MKNYDKYELEDFLKDGSFVLWCLAGEQSAVEPWSRFETLYPARAAVFRRAVEIGHSIRLNDYRMEESDVAETYESVMARYERFGWRKRYVNRLVRCAAIAAVILITLLPVGRHLHRAPLPGDADLFTADMQTGEGFGNIRLYVGGRSIAIPQNGRVRCDSTGIVWLNDNPVFTNLTFGGQMSRIIVPHGKRASLTLVDGTDIQLNAGTTVDFPTRFCGRERTVFADGEIYLEVTPDPGAPFIVKTRDFDVRVLGTKFNVSAYASDSVKYVVLAEGAVNVSGAAGDIRLRPDEMLTVGPSGTPVISSVDAYNYTSWTDGLLLFSKESFGSVIRRLSRHYAVNIDCDPALMQLRCSGKLYLFDDCREVFGTMSHVFPIRCTFENNTVRITAAQ